MFFMVCVMFVVHHVTRLFVLFVNCTHECIIVTSWLQHHFKVVIIIIIILITNMTQI